MRADLVPGVCPACASGDHAGCLELNPRPVERQGFLLDVRVDFARTPCGCQEPACLARRLALHDEGQTA